MLFKNPTTEIARRSRLDHHEKAMLAKHLAACSKGHESARREFHRYFECMPRSERLNVIRAANRTKETAAKGTDNINTTSGKVIVYTAVGFAAMAVFEIIYATYLTVAKNEGIKALKFFGVAGSITVAAMATVLITLYNAYKTAAGKKDDAETLHAMITDSHKRITTDEHKG